MARNHGFGSFGSPRKVRFHGFGIGSEPNPFALLILEVVTYTTAERGSSALLNDSTAWVPKHMRRLLKQIGAWIAANIDTPEWLTEAITERANDLKARLKADCWKRMSGAAPGEPDNDNNLAKLKPKPPSKAKVWNPKNRGMETAPEAHRRPRDVRRRQGQQDSHDRHAGTVRDQSRWHVWCVCDESKAADKQHSFWPGHWRSMQGNPANKNPGADGSTFNSFEARPAEPAKPAGSGKVKGKGGPPRRT